MFEKQKEWLKERLWRYDLLQFEKKSKGLANYLHQEKTGAKIKVLDVGCGDGRFAKFIEEHFNCDVMGVDTIDYLAVNLPFKTYDGNRLPVADKDYDVALCMAVIHHTNNPEALIKELHRSAKKVVLIEDYCSTGLGKIGLHLNDYFTNVVQNAYKWWCGYHKGSVFHMQWKLNFKTEAEIRDILKRNGINLDHYHRTPKSWKGMSHGVYVLS